MATNTIRMQIQFRRDTAANWELHKDVIPAIGEPCFVTDKNILKIGDGEKHFWELEPINGVKLEIAGDGKSIVLEDNVLKLMGFDGAEVGAHLVKGKDGTMKWEVPSTEIIDGLQNDVADLKTGIAGLNTNIDGLRSDVDGLKLDVSSLQSDGKTLLGKIEGLEAKVGAGEGTIDALIDAKINAWATNITDNELIDTIKETIDYVANHGGEVQGIVNDIADIRHLVGEDPVKDQIAFAIASKVDKVDGMGLSSNDFTDSLLGKLQAIEAGAQVNVIEKISVGGTILDAVDKTIDIPVAGLDRAGVVKSSTGVNKVSVDADGTMSVKKISMNNVFMPIGEELVLDGGSSSDRTSAYAVRIGNLGCNSISDAVAAAESGDVVALQENINMGAGDNDHLVVNADNVTIDLCGKELVANGSNGAVKVEGGMTVLEGAGAVKASLGSDKYSMAVWCENGTVVINDGTYYNSTDNSVRGTDLIYASNHGCIEINGGVFEAAKPEWTLNVKDADYKAGTSKIVVKGGKFKNFDPANNKSEGAGTNFVADGYKSVKEGDYYIVKPV